jgi:PKD repeat protein
MFGRKMRGGLALLLLLALAVPVLGAVPVADFSANVTSGYAPLTVQFTDESTGSPTTWFWELQESPSVTTNTQNVTHTYTEPGVHRIYLRVSNADGEDVEIKDGYITVLAQPTAPVAAFASDTATGGAPLTVQFADLSTGTPTAWAWDFDGDGVAETTEQNPSHTYEATGDYTVILQVSNEGGTDLETKTDYIHVGTLTATYLRAAFRFNVVGGTGGGGAAPLAVQFTDTTRANGTYARAWDFGDGTTSVEANPVHVYTAGGEYDVRLTVESDTRTNTERYTRIIKAYPAEASSPLPTNTYGSKMTQMMDSNWNLSVIGPLLPTPYTDLVPQTLFWGLLWGGVFMIYFVRQGTSWLSALLGIIIGGNILAFLPPEWQAAGQALLIVSIGAFLYVLIQGRIRSS